MKEKKQSKEYKTPRFQFVRQDEQNKVFFTASEEDPKMAGTLGTASQTTVASW